MRAQSEYIDSKLIKKTFTQQLDRSDCGAACLLSIVKYYKGDGDLEFYRDISGTNKEGTTLLGLEQAAEQIGLDAEGYVADIPSLIAHNQPVILHVIINEHLHHYIVCYGYDGRDFVIGDPAVGVKRLNAEENFVLNLLHELKKELIIFIVTHQMKVASKSDYIYVLEKNMIGSAGTPESLLLTDNFYSKGVNELISI